MQKKIESQELHDRPRRAATLRHRRQCKTARAATGCVLGCASFRVLGRWQKSTRCIYNTHEQTCIEDIMSSFARNTNDTTGPRFRDGHGQKRRNNTFTPRKTAKVRESAALEQQLLEAHTGQTKQQRIDAVMASSFSMTLDVARKVVAGQDKITLAHELLRVVRAVRVAVHVTTSIVVVLRSARESRMCSFSSGHSP